VLYLGGVGIPLGLVTGLATAMLLNAGVRGLKFYRTVFYLPNVVPGIASIILWLWILNSDPERGIMNWVWARTVTEWFGTPSPAWIVSEAWAKPALISIGLWGAAGGMILWLAGLKGIPNQLYEAASIDGARPVQQFWSITVPQLSPLIFFNMVMAGIGILQTFDSVYVATKGEGTGPNDALLVPVYYLFQNAFNYFKLGYASALAWVIFLVVMAITAVQFFVGKRWVHYEVGD
jgi:multiple sugar transport system permease protein